MRVFFFFFFNQVRVDAVIINTKSDCLVYIPIQVLNNTITVLLIFKSCLKDAFSWHQVRYSDTYLFIELTLKLTENVQPPTMFSINFFYLPW